jgi:hypothetical protein
MLATAELCGSSVVVRNDFSELLFPFNFTFSRRYEINVKTRVPDLFSLMGSCEVIMSLPLPVDVVKVVNAQADKVVKALRLNGGNIRFYVSVRLWGAWRSSDNFGSRTFPESIEVRRELGVPITNQMARIDSNIIQPHCGVPRLLKHPFFIGMKRGRTHENPAAVEVDKHQYVCVEFSLQRIDRLCEEVDCDKGFNMGADKFRPCTVRILQRFIWHGMKTVSLHDVADSRETDFDPQLFQFPKYPFVSPAKVFGGESDNQLDDSLFRFRSTALALRLFTRLLPQPNTIGAGLHHQHDIRYVMVDQGSTPHQFRAFLFLRDYSRIINSVAKHFNLIFQKLNPHIIPRHVKPRKKDENHLQKTRITVQLSQNENPQNLLLTMNLREATPFRTPVKTKKEENLLNSWELFDSKAGVDGSFLELCAC